MRTRKNDTTSRQQTTAAGNTPSRSDELPHPDQIDAATAAFAMLAEPTRLRLLWLLANGERDVGTLAELTGTTPSSTSQHLAKLRLAGLVTLRTNGRHHLYTTRDTHVRRLITEALNHADHLIAGRPDHP